MPFDDANLAKEYGGFMSDYFTTTYGEQENLFFAKTSRIYWTNMTQINSEIANIRPEWVQYYCDRASEYNECFRQGRYDRGEDYRQQRFNEVAEIESALIEDD